jgi:hypothetical protein
LDYRNNNHQKTSNINGVGSVFVGGSFNNDTIISQNTNNPSSKIFPAHSQRLFKENFAQK